MPSEDRIQTAPCLRLRERKVKGLGFEGAHGHPLSVDGIEAADCIAEDKEAIREAPEFFVAAPEAPGKTKMYHLREGLTVLDGLVQVGHS